MQYLNKYSIGFSSLVIVTGFLLVVLSPFLSLHVEGPISLVTESRDFHATKTNVWADLSSDEFDGVLHFLFTEPNGLNLTKGALATQWDNHVLLVEVLSPNKTDVVGYLDGRLDAPPRWARVSVSQPAAEEAFIYDYMVGPLPLDDAPQILPLEYCYNSGRSYVRNPVPNFEVLMEWLRVKTEAVADITLDLLGGDSHLEKSDPDSLNIMPRISAIENGATGYWLQFQRAGEKSDARSILPQGLYVKLVAPTRTPDSWELEEWYYNGILYNSTEMFRAALKSPDFERLYPNLDGAWTDLEDYGRGLPNRQIAAPVMVQPMGARYDIDRKERFVSWMGFEFYISFSQVTGIKLFDIKFRGERIIYELGMQEALAHYAGNDPTQGGLQFLDSFFGMGVRDFELVPGYDCPAYATYMASAYHVGEHTLTNENNICLFEYTADHALQRHTSESSVSISRAQYLVLRTVSTVGNYDYTFDYIFYLDGSVEVKVRASGFIFGAFHASSKSNNETKLNEYGYRVHDALATSMHDHVINFKADLDIAGTSNTLVRVGIEPLTKSFVWDEASKSPRNTMRLTHTPVLEETGLDWPRNSGEMYIVLNNDSTNSWGEKRGYRITPGMGMGTPSHLTVLNSTSLKASAEWASKDLWAVKQKDTEPRSASPMNWIEPANPLVDFSKFVDGENTVQEDLVIYFNLGAHHVPHSGDIPNTLMHTSASSVMFTPHNFHDHDPTRQSAQGVRLDLGASGKKLRYYGGRYKHGVVLNTTDLEPDMSQYLSTMHGTTDLSFNKSLIGT